MCNKEANFWSGGVMEQYACTIPNCVALVRQNFISSQGGCHEHSSTIINCRMYMPSPKSRLATAKKDMMLHGYLGGSIC
jgi:hypothetical protein